MVTGRVMLSLLTSLLFAISLPDFDQGWVGWFALVPLILACQGVRGRSGFIIGFISGAAALFACFSWLFIVPSFRWYHGVIISCWLALFPACWCAVLAWLTSRSLLRLLTVAACWISLDYLRSHAGFLSWSWATLAHTQHANLPLLQMAAWCGAYGISFVLIVANLIVAETIQHKKIGPVAILGAFLVLLHLSGLVALNEVPRSNTVRVAVVQPNIGREERKSEPGRKLVRQRLENLTVQSAAEAPELIVWPETAVIHDRNQALPDWLQRLAMTSKTPILTGVSEMEKFAGDPAGPGADRSIEQRRFNSAYFIPADQDAPAYPTYQKRILVPFAEYPPGQRYLDWPTWLVPSPNRLTAGDQYRSYALPSGLKVSPIICWEILFADYVRQLAAERPDIIVLLANDNWFGRSAAARQHNLSAVLRAVENRTTIVIASNAGPSQIIGPTGEVAATAALNSTTVVTAAIHPTGSESFYTAHGELFLFICTITLVAGWGSSLLLRSGRWTGRVHRLRSRNPRLSADVTVSPVDR